MTEVDALLEIATAIKYLALAVLILTVAMAGIASKLGLLADVISVKAYDFYHLLKDKMGR